MADDKRLERIEKKIDDTLEHMSNIDVTLAMQHVSLAEHIRRTELLENDIIPIKSHVAMVHGGLKVLGVIALVLGIIVSIIKVMHV